MYLRLKAPDARVFVTAPYHTTMDEVERFIGSNLVWIQRQRKKLGQLQQKQVRRYVTGEQVYVWGKAYELLVLTDPDMVRQLCGEEAADALLKHNMASVKLENSKLLLACPAGYDEAKREQCLDLWLKRQMEAFLPAIFQGCGSLVGKRESSWYVRKMKTRWGTCNIRTGRICINLNLGHLPPEYLSYIVIHELTHLWEKGHGEAFKTRMDLYYPQWRERRQEIIKLAYML
ncbi:MAG TPA: hypothetical protein DEG55_05165 [Acidaminococcaceae bacterium]|nr:hypothetical protein [Acidaminococcaceae bacterium]